MTFLDVSIPGNAEVFYSVYGNAYFIDFGLFGPNPPSIKTDSSSYTLVRQGTYYEQPEPFKGLMVKNNRATALPLRMVVLAPNEEFKHYN